jgi:hypothetical protein
MVAAVINEFCNVERDRLLRPDSQHQLRPERRVQIGGQSHLAGHHGIPA